MAHDLVGQHISPLPPSFPQNLAFRMDGIAEKGHPCIRQLLALSHFLERRECPCQLRHLHRLIGSRLLNKIERPHSDLLRQCRFDDKEPRISACKFIFTDLFGIDALEIHQIQNPVSVDIHRGQFPAVIDLLVQQYVLKMP